VVDASLQNAASVAVGGDLDAMSSDRIIDELVILRNQTVKALLNDMFNSRNPLAFDLAL